MKEVADVLAESREYIEKHGWTQHELSRSGAGTSVCSLGAIIYSQYEDVNVDNEDHVYDQHRGEIESVIRSLIKAGVPVTVSESPFTTIAANITGWNDMSERTQQEVLDLFAKAEKIERAGYDPDA